MTSIADSARTIALRAVLARMIGWSATHERFTRCVADGLTALAQARDGTVCIDDQRRPGDLAEMLDELHRPGARRSGWCWPKNARHAEVYTPAPVVILRSALGETSWSGSSWNMKSRLCRFRSEITAS